MIHSELSSDSEECIIISLNFALIQRNSEITTVGSEIVLNQC